MQEAVSTVKNTGKVRWWRKALLYVGCFSAVFELTAQLGFELRPHSIYPPLAWVAGLPPFETVAARRTSESGTPSAIYRGEKRRWAVVGSSWIDGVGLPQKAVWPELLRSRFARDDVHIATYSGANTAVLPILQNLNLQALHFDKLFIALDMPVESLGTQVELAGYFPHSRTWRNYSTRILLSVRTMAQLFVDSSFNLVSSKKLMPQPTRLAAYLLGADRAARPPFSSCYAEKLHERRCRELYKDVRRQAPQADPWTPWREVFLTCQTEVDRDCGVPSRVDALPEEREPAAKLQRAISEFYVLGSRLAEKVYFVSHPLRGSQGELPDLAVEEAAANLSLFMLPAGSPVVLNSTVGIESRFKRAAILEMISKAVTPDTIDLHKQLLTLSVGRAARFLDSSHLSRQGHVFAAGIIEARVRSDDSTL